MGGKETENYLIQTRYDAITIKPIHEKGTLDFPNACVGTIAVIKRHLHTYMFSPLLRGVFFMGCDLFGYKIFTVCFLSLTHKSIYYFFTLNRIHLFLCFYYIRGHSNNTWPPPLCDIFNFWWLIFRPRLLWNIEWIQNKVSIDALSCFVTKIFPSKDIKNSVLKSKKEVWHFVEPPPPLRASRIIWMTPKGPSINDVTALGGSGYQEFCGIK